MRTAATIIALGAAAFIGAQARATTASPPPTIPCSDIIIGAQPKTGTDAGYRIVLGIVSVPPARLSQVVPTHSTPWAYWRKAGLAIRASNTPVSVSIPKAWRTRAAITWGSTGNVGALKIAACSSPPKLWNAYAGGFYIRTRSECVPLTFKVGHRTRTVRFGIGGSCTTAG